MNLDQLKIYLPKYLSDNAEKTLFEELTHFPENKADSFFTIFNTQEQIIQGDCINDLPIYNLPEIKSINGKGVILSNSCDIDTTNNRHIPSKMLYAPLINLNKHRSTLFSHNVDPKKIESHIVSIKKQEVTQIIYFPSNPKVNYDSMVFLDHLISFPNLKISREDLSTRRLFTLSNFGLYLLLLKISIHFSRIKENIDRETSLTLPVNDLH